MLSASQLSPYVTTNMPILPYHKEDAEGNIYQPKKVSGMEFLKTWKNAQAAQAATYGDWVNEFDQVWDYQENQKRPIEPIEEEQNDYVEEPEIQASQSGTTQSPQLSSQQQNPMNQQQRRQFHTSRRRQTTAEPTITDTAASSKEWLDMSRAERKSLVNTETTQKLRALRKERGKHNPVTREERRAMKRGTKIVLRTELLGAGVLEDKKMFDKIMVDQGRQRKHEGLPKWTPQEKTEFIQDLVKNTVNVDPEQRKDYVTRLMAGINERMRLKGGKKLEAPAP
jgi:hypothetical protein